MHGDTLTTRTPNARGRNRSKPSRISHLVALASLWFLSFTPFSAAWLGGSTGCGSSVASTGKGGGPPSCSPGGAGLTDCGANRESCCTSLEVPGGTYFRTYDPPATDGGVMLAADGGPTGEADPATVSGFRLDKYLVTVGRFRQFVNAVFPPDGGTGWLPAPGAGRHDHLNGGQGLANSGNPGTFEIGWDTSWNSSVAPTAANLACRSLFDTWTSVPGSQENLPINCVNWYEAYAFCIWDGGFLPSEAEWEYAAAGGDQQREYPWGSTGPGTANQYAIYGNHYPGNSLNVAPVGTATLGVGLWGQLDMTGELWESTLDWYAPYADPCTDCADLTAASYRVIRGGAFADTASILFPAVRGNNSPPSDRGQFGGMRCARAP